MGGIVDLVPKGEPRVTSEKSSEAVSDGCRTDLDSPAVEELMGATSCTSNEGCLSSYFSLVCTDPGDEVLLDWTCATDGMCQLANTSKDEVDHGSQGIGGYIALGTCGEDTLKTLWDVSGIGIGEETPVGSNTAELLTSSTPNSDSWPEAVEAYCGGCDAFALQETEQARCEESAPGCDSFRALLFTSATDVQSCPGVRYPDDVQLVGSWRLYLKSSLSQSGQAH